MSVEQTLSIIKPDGVQKNLIGEIYGRFEKAGLEIVAARMIHFSQEHKLSVSHARALILKRVATQGFHANK